MQVKIKPSNISGTITAPASKSSMQRACAAALVSKGESIIYNPGKSNDDKAALDVIKSLGAIIEYKTDGSIKINSESFLSVPKRSTPGMSFAEAVNHGESGLGIRMFVPIIALSENEITINGEGSLLTRPMDFFDEILPQLGVEIKSNKGRLPLKVKGPLQTKNISIDGALSSQFLTGLLMAYSASNAKDVTIHVANLKSKPYVDLTLKVIKDFGLKVPQNKNYEAFYFSPDTDHLQSTTHHYAVEGDWSGAAFLLVAGAIAGNISVKGLDINSTQADKKILEALQDCGCKLLINENEIEVGKTDLKAFHFDATDCPDLFPPLAALSAYCMGITVIKGIQRLEYKESNRALTIQEELGKMNVRVELNEHEMKIHGGNGLKGSILHSRHDHRIAMMSAVAALQANGETVIEEAEAVKKSYPDFYEHIQSLGAKINIA